MDGDGARCCATASSCSAFGAGLRPAVPPARARRDAGLPRRGRAGRAAGAAAWSAMPRARSASPSSASRCCCSSSGSSSTRRRLWRMKQDIFGLGAAAGRAVRARGRRRSSWVGNAILGPAALALGLPLALSSTAQVLPMLQSAGRLRTPFGERAFSILLFQDLSIVPLITIVAVHVAQSGRRRRRRRAGCWRSTPSLAVVGLILAGRYLLRPLFRADRQSRRARDVRVRRRCSPSSPRAAMMESLGLSTALGAFVAGVMLADSPVSARAGGRCRAVPLDPARPVLPRGRHDARPARDRRAAVVRDRHGAGADRDQGGDHHAASAWLFRMNWRGALALGLLLSQGGEFGFVLFAQAQRAHADRRPRRPACSARSSRCRWRRRRS